MQLEKKIELIQLKKIKWVTHFFNQIYFLFFEKNVIQAFSTMTARKNVKVNKSFIYKEYQFKL